jgi:hypothetical protein
MSQFRDRPDVRDALATAVARAPFYASGMSLRCARSPVATAGALGACLLSTASCSLLLDWDDYTGGRDGGGATDAVAALDAAGAAREPDGAGEDAGQEPACLDGSCVTPPDGAGGPLPCDLIACKSIVSCLTSIQIPCCKADGTCGCEAVSGSPVCM